MKKILIRTVLAVFLTSSIVLSGCGKGSSVNEDAGNQIKELKSGDKAAFAGMLDEGIEDEKELFVLDFPKELREPYMDFLQKSFALVELEASSAKEKSDGSYSILVKFKPLDIEETTLNTNTAFQDSVKSSDLAAETQALLKEDIGKLKENAVYGDETTVTLKLKKDGDKYKITDKSLNALLFRSLDNYMSPYESVCELLNIQDFITAFLDAGFKGEFTQFMKHTGQTEEEMQVWYDNGDFDAPDDCAEDLRPRYKSAMQGVFKQCRYCVGIPKKAGTLSYTVDIAYSPNNSLAESFSAIQNGTYYSEREVDEAFIGLLETYAASPVYGEETSMNISVNNSSLMSSTEKGSDFYNLANAILPAPDVPE